MSLQKYFIQSFFYLYLGLDMTVFWGLSSSVKEHLLFFLASYFLVHIENSLTKWLESIKVKAILSLA